MQAHLRVQRYNGSFSGLHVHVKNYEKFMDGFRRDWKICRYIEILRVQWSLLQMTETDLYGGYKCKGNLKQKKSKQNCHPLSTTRVFLWQRAYTQNVNFETLNGGQFMLSTQSIMLNYPIYIVTCCIKTPSILSCIL